MDKASESIFALKPVTFRYKNDANETPQFGLVAEDVAKVDPDLVIPDRAGNPYTVRYEEVNAMCRRDPQRARKTNSKNRSRGAGGENCAQEKQIEALV